MLSAYKLFIIVIISASLVLSLLALGILVLLVLHLHFIRSLSKNVNEIKQILTKENIK